MPSTITFGGSGKTIAVPQLELQQFTSSADLENAQKVVVDNTVHIDKDHESDIIRIELGNDLKAPIVVNNTAYNPKKVFHVRPTGAVHTESNVYAHKVHAKYANGTQVDLLEHIDSEVAGVQDEVDDLTETLDSATHLDAGTDKLVKRSAANTTTINNLVVKADEVNRSAALYPPPGLLFDKGFCETSLSCLNDAQVVFQPYDNGGNEIAGRSYTFGRAEDNDDEKGGLHFQAITDVNATLRVRLNVGKKHSGVNMFEIRDHAGDTMFAIDEEGGVVYKGHEDADPKSEQHHASIALNDQSLYIGSMRLSFDRPNGELVMHVIARVPAYLAALGYSLPVGQAYTDYGVHDYCKFARDLASDQSLKISDVFPTATADDWTSYLPEATRNINTNITTHLTPMVNPQAYRNIHVEALTVADSPFQVADDTWLQVIKHDNTSGLEVYLPDDPEDGQVSRIKNLNTSGDAHIIVSLNVANIAAGVTIDGRFTSVQLNGSGSGSSPDTQTNQCSTMVFIEDIAAGSYWVRVGDGY